MSRKLLVNMGTQSGLFVTDHKSDLTSEIIQDSFYLNNTIVNQVGHSDMGVVVKIKNGDITPSIVIVDLRFVTELENVTDKCLIYQTCVNNNTFVGALVTEEQLEDLDFFERRGYRFLIINSSNIGKSVNELVSIIKQSGGNTPFTIYR